MKPIGLKRKEIKNRRAKQAGLHRTVPKAKTGHASGAKARHALYSNTPVNIAALAPNKLAPYEGLGNPDFIERGYYVDLPFACACCGVEQVWKATQQKWWYEVAKGTLYSTAKYCRVCRRKKKSGLMRPQDASRNFDRYLASQNGRPLPPIK